MDAQPRKQQIEVKHHISLLFLAIGVLINLSFFIPNKSLAKVVSKIKCDTTFGPTLNRELQDFLKSPAKSKFALELASKLCLTSAHGSTPCPVAVAGERIGQLNSASKKVGATIVPIAACIAEHAEGAVKEDFYDWLGDAVDKFGSAFYRAYFSISATERKGAASLDSFITTGTSLDSIPAKKVALLQKRLEVLDTIQVSAAQAEEVGGAKKAIEAALPDVRLEAQQEQSEGSSTFGASLFDREIINRLLRFKTNDPVGLNEVAEKLRTSFGLTYVVELKPDSPSAGQAWTLCPANGGGECKPITVQVYISIAECDVRQSLIAVKKRSLDSAIVVSKDGRVHSLNPATQFSSFGVVVELRDSVGKAINRWTLPTRSYQIAAISPDLKKIYAKRTIKSLAGSNLGDLTLAISDTGETHFEPIEQKPNAPLSFYPLQSIEGEQPLKTTSGTEYKIAVTKLCESKK